MNRILFPTDFSTSAQSAYKYALELAKLLTAKVDVLHVYKLPLIDATNVPPDYLNQVFEEKQLAVMRALKDFTKETPEEVKGTIEAVYGIFVPEEIIALAKSNKHYLIVMGTRGENHSMIEKIMGSVTTNTLLGAKCPVIAVPDECQWKAIERISWATGLLPQELAAVEQMRILAARLNAVLDFVHIETEPEIGSMEDKVTLDDYPFKDVDFTVINDPSVMEGLEKHITQNSIDMLAMFVPQRGLWDRLFHSSLTKKMAFHIKTPLLIFHEHFEEEEE